MRTMRRTSVAAGAALGLILSGLAVVAAADTPPPAPQPGTAVEGVLPGPAKAKQDGISLKTQGDVTVRTFALTYPAGAESGWHRHPGIVIAVVSEGTVTRQAGCKTETFTKGDSFTEVGPHDVTNPGDVQAVLSITQILPKGAPTRLPADPPVCPPHHHHGH